MSKPILYVDLDGVAANFDKAIRLDCPRFDEDYIDQKSREDKVDEICLRNNRIFLELEPIFGSIEAIKYLSTYFELYFLSTPMWLIPESFTDKRLWVEKHFGEVGLKRLILTHRKDLSIGDYLIDDRLANGAGFFRGKHIHFGTEEFPDWLSVTKFLMKQLIQITV